MSLVALAVAIAVFPEGADANCHGRLGISYDKPTASVSIVSPTGTIDSSDPVTFQYTGQRCTYKPNGNGCYRDRLLRCDNNVNGVYLYVDGVLRATGGGGTNTVTLGPFSQAAHTYEAQSIITAWSCKKSRGQTNCVANSYFSYMDGATSGVRTFSVIASCNNNGACNSGETASNCPADCDASCTSDGLCGVKEPLTCSDCSACDKDGICEAGEAGVCPVDCPASFALALDPDRVVAEKGDSKTVNATLTLSSGATSPVALSISGVPAGTTSALSQASCSPSCYSNLTVNTSSSTPEGSHNITVTGVSGLVTKAAYYNLTVLPSGVPATCGAPTTCDPGETQSNCAADCFTTATMPSPVTPGEIVSITVEFEDFRYLANGKVKIDLSIDGTTTWNSANGCNIGGMKMGPTNANGATAWPSGTTSEDGHFEVTALCTVPSSIGAGAHTLFATPTIY